MRITVINPNTSRRTTALMLDLARRAAGEGTSIQALTAGSGVPMIVTEKALQEASCAVAALAPDVIASQPDAVLVAAFGDPGVSHLRGCLDVDVVGIGEASLGAAAHGGRGFAVVTTTPEMDRSIRRRVAALGLLSQFTGLRVTRGDPLEMMKDEAQLLDAMRGACALAIQEDGAEAIVIGGGPLAPAARILERELAVPVIEPVSAGIRWLISRRDRL